MVVQNVLLVSFSSHLSKLKVPALKELLAKRNLDTKGKKAELISRLTEAIEKEKEVDVEAVDEKKKIHPPKQMKKIILIPLPHQNNPKIPH